MIWANPVQCFPTSAAFEATTPLGGSFACGGQTPTSRAVVVPAAQAAGPAVLQWFWKGDAGYWDCVDITISAAAAAGGDEDELSDGAALIELVFGGDVADVTDLASWKAAFAADLGVALDIPPAQIDEGRAVIMHCHLLPCIVILNIMQIGVRQNDSTALV